MTDLQQELPKEERKETCKDNAKTNSKRGDCTRRITKVQRSFGDSCPYQHEPNKRGKGEGRLRFTFSDRFSRHSKGDGDNGDDGGARGIPTCTGKRLQEKQCATLCQLQDRKLSHVKIK